MVYAIRMKKLICILIFICEPILAEASIISIDKGEAEFSESQMQALQELESIVLRHLGINQEVEGTMAVRARKSAWLPTVTLYGDFDQNQGTAEKKGQNGSVLEKGERDFGAGVRLTFDLGRLVYSSAEVDLKNLDLKKFEKREETIQTLHKAYFRYIRLKNAQGLDTQKGRFALLKLEMLEVLATLNSLSGGAFSNMPNLQ